MQEAIDDTLSEPSEANSDSAVLTVCFNILGEQARIADSIASGPGPGPGPNGVPANLTTSALLRDHLTTFFVANGLQYLNEGVFISQYPICEASIRISQVVARYAAQYAWTRSHPSMGRWIVGLYITSTDRAPYDGAAGWGY